MRIFGIILFGMLTMLLTAQLYHSYDRYRAVKKTHDAFQAQLYEIERDQDELESDLNFYRRPENLEKELRARFNFKKPGETMIIIVPTSTSTENGQ